MPDFTWRQWLALSPGIVLPIAYAVYDLLQPVIDWPRLGFMLLAFPLGWWAVVGFVAMSLHDRSRD